MGIIIGLLLCFAVMIISVLLFIKDRNSIIEELNSKTLTLFLKGKENFPNEEVYCLDSGKRTSEKLVLLISRKCDNEDELLNYKKELNKMFSEFPIKILIKNGIVAAYAVVSSQKFSNNFRNVVDMTKGEDF